MAVRMGNLYTDARFDYNYPRGQGKTEPMVVIGSKQSPYTELNPGYQQRTRI
jgi:hypothetical protein